MLLNAVLLEAQNKLTAAGVDNPVLDARLLIAFALDCSRADLVTQSERSLSSSEKNAIAALIARRIRREPVARIIGQREFWGLPFALNEATLEPRPDSETMIEAALEKTRKTGAPASILDLGTGTGCLLLSLLHEWPHAKGTGVDRSSRALEQASANAQALGLADRAVFVQSDWFENIHDTFDLIISNPPYIAAKDLADLQPEVRKFDPQQALDGGADGLAPYRLLIPQLQRFLTPHGQVFFEVGLGQAQSVAALLRQAGLTEISITPDLGGIERIVGGQR